MQTHATHPRPLALDIDREIEEFVRDTPGIPAASVVRALTGMWTTTYIRDRITHLGALGVIHIEKSNGRLFLHPPATVD